MRDLLPHFQRELQFLQMHRNEFAAAYPELVAAGATAARTRARRQGPFRKVMTGMRIKSATALVLLAAISSSRAAGAPQQPPRITGQQLIDHFQAGADLPVTSRTSESIMRTQIADGYLADIADAFHGPGWCSDGSVKHDEINSAVIFSLKKLSNEKLARPATELVKESLSRPFACGK